MKLKLKKHDGSDIWILGKSRFLFVAALDDQMNWRKARASTWAYIT